MVEQLAFNQLVLGSSPSPRTSFILQSPPKLIDDVERGIRKHEPWLMGEATVEDIDEQIVNLTEMREAKIKEDSGNAS